MLSNIYQRIVNTIGMKKTLIDQINSAVLSNIYQRIANTIGMKNTLVVYSFLKYIHFPILLYNMIPSLTNFLTLITHNPIYPIHWSLTIKLLNTDHTQSHVSHISHLHCTAPLQHLHCTTSAPVLRTHLHFTTSAPALHYLLHWTKVNLNVITQ